MNAPAADQKQREARQLARIRDQHAMLGGAEWLRAQDDMGAIIETRCKGEILTIARFHDRATEDEIRFACDAENSVGFLLQLLDRATRTIRELRRAAEPSKPQADPTKDYAAEAGMRCADPAFKAFLEDRHGLERPLTDERVAQKLRSLLGVTSRRELNEAGATAERWKALKSDFENWKRTGR